VLTLLPDCPPCLFMDPPCLPPVPAEGCYLVGSPGEAVAFIRDNDQVNVRPKVQIVKPQNGDTFPARSDIEIDVKTQDPDGWVHTVEFFANGVKIGAESIEFIVAPPPNQEQMFSLIWSNVTAGRYILTANATDDVDGATTSQPVTILVGDVPPLVPSVSIVATDPFRESLDEWNQHRQVQNFPDRPDKPGPYRVLFRSRHRVQRRGLRGNRQLPDYSGGPPLGCNPDRAD